MKRPYPPAEMLANLAPSLFVPADDLEEWAMATFVEEGGKLHNPEHAHLQYAEIGFLWTNVGNSRHMSRIVGQAEPGTPRAMGKWAKARAELQIMGWFGQVPDFIVTIDADYAASVGDAEFCALVEHELYHCGQERDLFGAPKFTRAGRPVFAMKGHDVEEFVGIVRRYGVGASAGQTSALVEAAKRRPEIAPASLAQACGTCLKVAA